MKIDEVSLQHVLRAYGKVLKPRPPIEKERPQAESTAQRPPIPSERSSGTRYDNNGQLQVSAEERKRLIDFFE